MILGHTSKERMSGRQLATNNSRDISRCAGRSRLGERETACERSVDHGDLIWQRDVHAGFPDWARHIKNSYASETPCIGRATHLCLLWQRRDVRFFTGWHAYLESALAAAQDARPLR